MLLIKEVGPRKEGGLNVASSSMKSGFFLHLSSHLPAGNQMTLQTVKNKIRQSLAFLVLAGDFGRSVEECTIWTSFFFLQNQHCMDNGKFCLQLELG